MSAALGPDTMVHALANTAAPQRAPRPIEAGTPSPAPVPDPTPASPQATAHAVGDATNALGDATQALRDATKALRDATDTRGAPLTQGGSGKTLSFLCAALAPTKLDRVAIERMEVNRRPTDPLTVELTVDPSAAYVAIVNAERFDPSTGKPLLLGVLVREGADPQALDLSAFQRGAGDPFRTMAPGQTRVTYRNVDDRQFDFGAPIAQVTYDASAIEQSRSVNARPLNQRTQIQLGGPTGGDRQTVTSGPSLDRTPVQTLTSRLRLELANVPKGWWPGDPAPELAFRVAAERGLVQQPGAEVSIAVRQPVPNSGFDDGVRRYSPLGAPLKSEVAIDDASFAGSAPMRTPAHPIGDFATFLGVEVALTTASASRRGDQRFDQRTETLVPLGLLRAQRQGITIGGVAPECDTLALAAGARVDGLALTASSLTLDAGFVRSSGPSVRGWHVEVGYRGDDGAFRALAGAAIEGERASEAMTVPLKAAARRPAGVPLEVRVTDDRSVPARRITVAVD